MTTNDISKQVERFRFRLSGTLALRESVRLLFAWVMIWAAVGVGLRAVFRLDPALLLWGFIGVALALAVALLRAVRGTPSAGAIRAILDAHGALGGLLMAAELGDIGGWKNQIAALPTPLLRWRWRRSLALLAMGVSFLLAAFLAPDRYVSADSNALQVGGEIQKLAERIRVLKQQDVLPQDKAKAIEKELERLRRDAEGKDPAKTLEALDHLEQSFSKAAAAAAESAIKQAEQANKLEELAKALQHAAGQMGPQKFAEAMKELAQLAQEAAADDKQLNEKLQEALGDGNGGELTAEQLAKLAKAMQGCKADDKAKLMKLVEAQLVDAAELTQCDDACQCDEGALLAALGEEGEEGEPISIDGDGLPGRGGLNRGRGDAAMTWQDEVNKGSAAFKEKVLPSRALASMKKSRLVGISVGAPTSSKPGGGSVGGALASAAAGGGEGRTQTILPEHEKAVERYFHREEKK